MRVDSEVMAVGLLQSPHLCPFTGNNVWLVGPAKETSDLLATAEGPLLSCHCAPRTTTIKT